MNIDLRHCDKSLHRRVNGMILLSIGSSSYTDTYFPAPSLTLTNVPIVPLVVVGTITNMYFYGLIKQTTESSQRQSSASITKSLSTFLARETPSQRRWTSRGRIETIKTLHLSNNNRDTCHNRRSSSVNS